MALNPANPSLPDHVCEGTCRESVRRFAEKKAALGSSAAITNFRNAWPLPGSKSAVHAFAAANGHRLLEFVEFPPILCTPEGWVGLVVHRYAGEGRITLLGILRPVTDDVHEWNWRGAPSVVDPWDDTDECQSPTWIVTPRQPKTDRDGGDLCPPENELVPLTDWEWCEPEFQTEGLSRAGGQLARRELEEWYYPLFLGRTPRGRPVSSGLWNSREEFLECVSDAYADVRRRTRRPTQVSVALRLEIDESTLKKNLRKFDVKWSYVARRST